MLLAINVERLLGKIRQSGSLRPDIFLDLFSVVLTTFWCVHVDALTSNFNSLFGRIWIVKWIVYGKKGDAFDSNDIFTLY